MPLKQFNFGWLVTPRFCYAIWIRALKEAILEISNRFYLHSHDVKIHIKPMLNFKKSKLQIDCGDTPTFFVSLREVPRLSDITMGEKFQAVFFAIQTP
jgi:hypothetical protein